MRGGCAGKAAARAPLQWGLVLADEDAGPGRKRLAHTPLASMGPRPRGRGCSACLYAREPADVLQWGLVLADEDAHLRPAFARATPSCFNGASSSRTRMQRLS